MIVHFTLPALADLDAIEAYIARQNPKAAHKVATELAARAAAIAHMPYAGRKTDEEGGYLIVMPHLHYYIFYEIAGDTVNIVHIRHTSRDDWKK